MLRLNKNSKYLLYFILLLVIVFILFPVFIGENSLLWIHDNLDSNAGWAKMFKDNNLFFTLNTPTPSFGNLSSLYFMQINYSLYSAIFCFLPTFTAYLVNYYIAVTIGFISMFLLLKKIRVEDDFIIIIVSVTFAVLPKFYWAAMPISSMPILIIAFLNIVSKNTGFYPKSLLLIFFPLISSFTFVGIFALSIWLIASVIISIHSKKIKLNLFIAFFVLCIGYIFVELKLFYHALIVKEPLNRSIFSLGSNNVWSWFKTYFWNGYYHFPSLQRKLIIPVLFLFLFLYSLTFLKTKFEVLFEDIKKRNIFIIIFLLSIIILLSFIASLYDSIPIKSFLNSILPALSGFNWGRFWVLNIPLWYILFAVLISQINILLGKKWIGYIIVLLQLTYVLVTPIPYNDNIRTWYNELLHKTRIDKKIGIDKTISKKIAGGSGDFISFDDFFDTKLFEKIKEDIKYKGEKVVAFGYHPSVLMYNGFYTIDGYSSIIPLSYMRKFGKLLEPEFQVNPEAREYYDSWGGRMYLYHDGFDFYEPKLEKPTVDVPLRVDMNMLKKDFNVQYVLSRVKILANDRMQLIGSYTHDNSIYTIYVYKVL
jgi:hypothetical protein